WRWCVQWRRRWIMERVWGAEIVDRASAERCAMRWALAGAAAWAVVAVLSRIGVIRIGVIELMFLFGPLVIVPLGLELSRVGMKRVGFWMELAQSLQPLGAVFALTSITMAPGRAAGLVALGWFLVCMVAAIAGMEEFAGVLKT